MTIREQLRESMRQIIETYHLALENTLMLPGGAPQQQWDDLQLQFMQAMEWADLISAEKTRYRGIGERIIVPVRHEASYREIVEINPWVEQHVEKTHPLINWRAEKTAVIEREYLEKKAKLAQYAGVPVDKIAEVVPHYRLDMFRRNSIGEVANVAEQVQLAIQEVGDAFPFTQLNSRGDARVRPTHSIADGLIAPRTHPIWSVIRPLNGFSCRCFLIQISRRQAIQRGLMTATGKTQLQGVSWPSKAAERAYQIGIPYHGASYDKVPRRIAREMFPDAGWTGPKATASAIAASVAA